MATFGIKTAPMHTTWDGMLEVWRTADEIDVFSSAWNFDHFLPIHGDPEGPCMEAWVTLTALTQATSRLRVGCMVHGMHFRHPAVTANMAATLDIVSGGRLDLGLGAGWFEPESRAYGLELGSLKDRMDRFDEGVEIIARMLTQETTTFDGRFYSLSDARCEPKGPQDPRPPIAIGGTGEQRTLRTVARRADIWDALMVDPSDYGRLNEVLLARCDEVGRDPSEITRSAHMRWKADDEPGAVAERAAALFDAGLDLVILSMAAPHTGARVEAVAGALAEVGR